MALSKIGDTRAQLDDVDTENTNISRQCLLHYEQTLHELIRMHSWNCAKGRAKLIDSGSTPLFGWEYSFDIPAGCIRPIALTNTDASLYLLKPRVEWAIEGDAILCNSSEVWLLYIKEPSPTEMDSLFVQAFYTFLASKLAKPIAGDSQLGMQIYDDFLNVIMPEARRVNSFEGNELPVIDSEWLEATFTSNSASSQSSFSQSSYGTFPWG